MEAGSTPPAPQEGSRRGLVWVLIVTIVVVAVVAVAAVVFFWPEDKERITVPDVVGLSTESAERVLEAAGFALGEVDYASVAAGSAEVDTVLSQVPAAGSEADAGSEVAVVVGGAPGDATKEDEEATPPPAGSGGSGSGDAPETEPEAGPESDGDVHFDEPEPEPEPTWHTLAAGGSKTGESVENFDTTSQRLRLTYTASADSVTPRSFRFSIYSRGIVVLVSASELRAGYSTETRTREQVLPVGEYRIEVSAPAGSTYSYVVQEWR